MQLTTEQVRLRRFYAQQFTSNTSYSDVQQLVRDTCGVQSQELSAAYLGIRARTQNLTLDAVRHIRENERTIVLTWTMRGTLHLISADDIDWMLTLFGEMFIRKTERRYKQLDLDEAAREEGVGRIHEILSKQGALTRVKLADALRSHGIPVEGQAIHHLVRYAALRGIICFGAERDGELTSVLLDDWLPVSQRRRIDEDTIPHEITYRYLQAFAPATPQDLVTWSGIGMKQAKAGFAALENDLVSVIIESDEAWMLREQVDSFADVPSSPQVRLLPRFDNYLLGHKKRDFIVDSDFAKQIYRGGIISQAMLVNGQAIGIWKVKKRKHMTDIIIEPFEEISRDVLAGLDVEAKDIGNYLNQNTELVLID